MFELCTCTFSRKIYPVCNGLRDFTADEPLTNKYLGYSVAGVWNTE